MQWNWFFKFEYIFSFFELFSDDWNNWKITFEDRLKHDERFQFLRPVNGFITGEQARNFFTQSKLPTPVLAKIWSLADLTADGQLDRKEFSIAMYLIKKCLEGNSLPMQLPPTLLLEPQRFIPPIPQFDPLAPVSTVNQNNGNNTGSSAVDSNDWSISSALRPKYKLQFNQNDRNKRGYLTGVEARGIFLKSNLPQSQLAAIWNLADVDKDGNLTCEEFCIAAYLIDQVLAGRKLPATLPPSLMPPAAVSFLFNFFPGAEVIISIFFPIIDKSASKIREDRGLRKLENYHHERIICSRN